jgi:CheY-like chemotaxis protein/anti-sigma regulatory factor (Ser/Thr protein kinase)
MSHEIRTPINVMMGMTEMILCANDADEITSYGAAIQSAGRMLINLINNILDVSKIESGNFTIMAEPYRTSDLLLELVWTGMEPARKREIRFSVDADENLPSGMIGDFIHIKQVVTNFITNAIKYTDQGGVSVRISQKADSADTGKVHLVISVADTGIGIKKENLGVLFDAFTRVDLLTHRNIEGTGLGLAIAKTLTDLMGGGIQVESELGKGSVFTVVIPQAVADPEPLGSTRLLEKKIVKPQKVSFVAPAGRVLVVDDNPENVQVIKSLLSRTLLRVDTALSGAECLEIVKNERYDLLFMDYMMPEMDGIETYKRLREEVPNFAAPVAALTANAIAGADKMFLEAGFAAYITKPIMWKELEDTLLKYLPPHLISKIQTEAPSWVTEDLEAELRKDLASYDIAIEEGLKYVNGDMALYAKMAEIFLEGYERGESEAKRFIHEKDWNQLMYKVHSLKSASRSVGAMDLRGTAAFMETRCRRGDGASVEASAQLLFLQWERVCAGLRHFTERIASFREGDQTETAKPDLDALLDNIHNHRYKPAMAELCAMLAVPADRNLEQILESVKTALADLNFEEAEREAERAFAALGREVE